MPTFGELCHCKLDVYMPVYTLELQIAMHIKSLASFRYLE